MGKKHKHPEHENLERWLVSYADFITLLFATFVVLYALSQVDLAKFKNVSKGIKSAFKPSLMENTGGIMSGDVQVSVLKETGNSILEQNVAKFPPNDERQGSLRPVSQAVGEAQKELNKLKKNQGQGAGKGKGKGKGQGDGKGKGKGQGGGGKGKGKGKGEGSGSGGGGTSTDQLGITVEVQQRGIVISLSSGIFFDSGSAAIKPEAYKVLDALAPTLKKNGDIIHIEGHTDNQPIASAIYPSNWELSSARAGSVVRYLIKKHGFSSSKLAAVGYGEGRPKVSNGDETSRSKNRRVDIVILNPVSSQLIDPPKDPKIREMIDAKVEDPHSKSDKTSEKEGHSSDPHVKTESKSRPDKTHTAEPDHASEHPTANTQDKPQTKTIKPLFEIRESGPVLYTTQEKLTHRSRSKTPQKTTNTTHEKKSSVSDHKQPVNQKNTSHQSNHH